MSEQRTNANLLENGDFTKQGQHWLLPQSPAKFEDGYCLLQTGTVCYQMINSVTEGNYRLTVKMKADPFFICKVRVEMTPSFTFKDIEPFDGNDWTAQTLDFEAPAGTRTITVKLTAGDGPIPAFGSYFDDVRLERR